MEDSMEIPLKTKNRTAIWSSNPTSGDVLNRDEVIMSKRTLCTLLVAAMFTIAKL
jgi:hypothetical protein